MNLMEYGNSTSEPVALPTRDSFYTQMTDAQLLSRYAQQGDENAFATIVRRHGPLVLGVCQRILADRHTAEDAFQATFLVLIRKADSLQQPERLSNWLYGVAYKIATRFRQQYVPARPAGEPIGNTANPVDEVLAADLQQLLDDEICRLPPNYRLPLVLCCLEGKTYEDAARTLKCSTGTVKSRLSRARARLQNRLRHHGWAVGLTGLVSLLLPEHLCAEVPVNLLEKTCRGEIALPADVPVSDWESAHLTDHRFWLKPVVVAVALLLLFGTGGVFLVMWSGATQSSGSVPALPAQPLRAVQIDVDKPPPAPRRVVIVDCWPNILKLDRRIKFVATSARGIHTAVVLEDGTAVVHNGIQKKKVAHFDKRTGPWSEAAFSSDEKWLALVSAADHEVRLFDFRTGTRIVRLKNARSDVAPLFAPHEPILLCRENARTLVFWNLLTEEATSLRSKTPLSSVWAFSPNGTYLAAAHTGGTVMICRVKDTALVQCYTPEAKTIHALAFSGTGHELAISTENGITLLTVGQDGKLSLRKSLVRQIATNPYYALAFDNYDRLLAVNRDGIDVWQRNTGKKLGRLQDYQAQPGCFAVSQTGIMAATANGTATLYVWGIGKSKLTPPKP